MFNKDENKKDLCSYESQKFRKIRKPILNSDYVLSCLLKDSIHPIKESGVTGIEIPFKMVHFWGLSTLTPVKTTQNVIDSLEIRFNALKSY